MKTRIAVLAVFALAGAYGMAQPGDPATNGMTPRGVTFYENQAWNNNGLNSLGVDITSNLDVVVGFEDDNTPSYAMRHWAAVWTLYDKDGVSLTPVVTITNSNPLTMDITPQSIDTHYRAFFRNDGVPISGRTAWGPKIKANRFGGGFGMSAVSYALHQHFSSSGTNGIGNEIPHLFDIGLDLSTAATSTNASGVMLTNIGNSFAPLQLMNNDQTPAGPVLAGGTDANYEPAGGNRTADWDYLANGNIVTVDEGRQLADRPPQQTAGEYPIYRVQTPAGVEVKAYTLVSSVPATNNSAMWHGVGVTSNGFAIRFRWQGRATMRLFDNDGNPTSANIDLETASGLPGMVGGDRGDGAGFHGNGTDAYVHACSFGGTVYVGVFNANGTVRWARRVADQTETPLTDRVDAAIHPDGRVVVIFDARNLYPSGTATNRTVAGRMFDRFGEPIGGIFWVSENENPAPVLLIGTQQLSRNARVAWRDNLVAVVWESGSGPQLRRLVGFRMFDTPAYTPAAPGSITGFTGTRSGNNMTFTWSGGSPPFKIQKKTTIDGGWGDVTTGLSYRNGSASITTSDQGYYRVVGQGPQ